MTDYAIVLVYAFGLLGGIVAMWLEEGRMLKDDESQATPSIRDAVEVRHV